MQNCLYKRTGSSYRLLWLKERRTASIRGNPSEIRGRRGSVYIYIVEDSRGSRSRVTHSSFECKFFKMSNSANLNLLLINGPNLNLLGTREPSVYGSETLDDVHTLAKTTASKYDVNVMTYQSNHEGAIIDRIHQAREEGVKGILINPGWSISSRQKTILTSRIA